MDLPILLDTYKAIKSIPPVEAFPLKAIVTIIPFANPPIIIFKSGSSNNGPQFNISRKILAANTSIKEKNVNRLLILLLHKTATGIFSTNIPMDAEKENPQKGEVIFSIKIANPVKPLERRFIGLIKIWISI